MQRPSGIAISTALSNGGAGGGGGSRVAGMGATKNAPSMPYRGSADTFRTILRTEGLRGIYKVRPPKGQRAQCFALFQQDAEKVVCLPGWGGLCRIIFSATVLNRRVRVSFNVCSNALRLKLPTGIRGVSRVENKERHRDATSNRNDFFFFFFCIFGWSAAVCVHFCGRSGPLAGIFGDARVLRSVLGAVLHVVRASEGGLSNINR